MASTRPRASSISVLLLRNAAGVHRVLHLTAHHFFHPPCMRFRPPALSVSSPPGELYMPIVEQPSNLCTQLLLCQIRINRKTCFLLATTNSSTSFKNYSGPCSQGQCPLRAVLSQFLVAGSILIVPCRQGDAIDVYSVHLALPLCMEEPSHAQIVLARGLCLSQHLRKR